MNNLYEYGMTPLSRDIFKYNSVESFLGLSSIDIYSSPKIEKEISDFLNGSQIIKPIKALVNKGIKNKKIIIGYVNPSKFNFLYNRISYFFGKKGENILGFYDYSDKTLYIILDNNVDMFGKSIINIDGIVIHELCHMSSNYNHSNFFNKTYSDFLYPYYKYVFLHSINYFFDNSVLINKNFDKFLKISIYNLLKLNESSNLDIDEKIKNAYDVWNNFIKHVLNSNDPLKNKLLVDCLISTYIVNYNKSSNIVKNKEVDTHIMGIEKILVDAYKHAGITKVYNIPGQEILFPSEIVAICNQNGIRNKVRYLFNDLIKEI